MKRDYGKWALFGSLLSWVVLIASVLLSWWAIPIEFAGHKAGDPRPDTPMLDAFHFLTLLSFPMSIASMVLAAIGVAKGHSAVSAVIGGLVAMALFGFLLLAMWMGSNF